MRGAPPWLTLSAIRSDRCKFSYSLIHTDWPTLLLVSTVSLIAFRRRFLFGKLGVSGHYRNGYGFNSREGKGAEHRRQSEH